MKHLLLLLCAATLHASDGKLIVTYLGMPEHGLAIVVQTPSGKTWMIDTGHQSDKYDAGRDTIEPFLKARGITQLDGIAISHPHGDHYGGALWLLDHLPVKTFVDTGYSARGLALAYSRIRQHAQERGAKYITATEGDTLDFGPELTVEVLSPPKQMHNTDTDPAKITEHGLLNTNSLFLRLQHGKNVFFFPGDAYGTGQRYVLEHTSPERLKATVVTAPHHGFNTHPEFVTATKPKFAIASCLAFYAGSEVPSPGDKLKDQFEPLGTKVFVTAWNGNIEITSDGVDVTAKTEREGK
ncbi:MBL fold metallo-hydrolase [Prosthecobacter sp.]|uniref:ComEC/Rec2 family competence protein n=1 Tax=Prosthecobacter sp. TaxID=1965333 RepID=UPI00248868A3|nr:MBL fold metallo-hydrolase [Prosthecobacter sp.]MDI1313437.1 MBL fold metallo-hydrolase [Prosthecobacter sp.]